jgi:hypothetical protein
MVFVLTGGGLGAETREERALALQGGLALVTAGKGFAKAVGRAETVGAAGSVAPTEFVVRRSTPAEIAARGEEWAQNTKYGTCATAALHNCISATIEGYKNQVIRIVGGRVTPGTGELSSSTTSPILVPRVHGEGHIIVEVIDEHGTPHFLSGGRAYATRAQVLRDTGLENPMVFDRYSSPAYYVERHNLDTKIDFIHRP